MLAEDAADLRVLVADGLFPVCTTWIVLPRDRVLRDFALEFIALFAPQIDRRDVRRAFDHGDFAGEWPPPPGWRDLVDSKSTGACCRLRLHTSRCRPHSLCSPKKRVPSASMLSSQRRVVCISPIET